MGEYTCVAKNAAGATNFSTSLHVNGLPLTHLPFEILRFFLLKLLPQKPSDPVLCFRIKI
jgi:hypothetical protein